MSTVIKISGGPRKVHVISEQELADNMDKKTGRIPTEKLVEMLATRKSKVRRAKVMFPVKEEPTKETKPTKDKPFFESKRKD